MTARTLLRYTVISLFFAVPALAANAWANHFLTANAHRLCFAMVDCKKPYVTH